MRYTVNVNLNAAMGVIGLVTLIIVVGLWGPLAANIRWLLIIGILTAFLMGIGKQVGGRYDSALIDSRYKISLSRFQITLWTILVLSAFLTMALDRNIPALTGNAIDDLEPLNIHFPEQLLLALGISTASLAGSSLIKRTKTEMESGRKIEELEEDINKAIAAHQAAQDDLNKAEQEASALTLQQGQFSAELTQWQQEIATIQAQIDDGAATPEQLEFPQLKLAQAQAKLDDTTEKLNLANQQASQAEQERDKTRQELATLEQAKQNKKGIIHQNQNPAEAEWSDLFRGDEIVNYRVIDIAKVQMFFFTIAIIFSYGVLVWSLLSDPGQLRASVLEFPPFSSSLNGLLGLSHAGYLAVKGTS